MFGISREGWGQVLEHRDEQSITVAIEELSIAGKSAPLNVESGAIELAKQLTQRS